MPKLTLPDGSVYETGEFYHAHNPATPYWDGETVKSIVVKASDEKRFTLQVAYPADSPDAAVARDGFQDFASKDAVEAAAHGYMAKHRNVGLHHAEGTDGAGTVVESYIYRGPDWRVEGADGSAQVIKAGDWLMGIVWDEPAWNLIKSGELTGVSMQGGAKRQVPSPSDIARVVAAKNGRQ